VWPTFVDSVGDGEDIASCFLVFLRHQALDELIRMFAVFNVAYMKQATGSLTGFKEMRSQRSAWVLSSRAQRQGTRLLGVSAPEGVSGLRVIISSKC